MGRLERWTRVLIGLVQLFTVVMGPLEHARTTSRLGAHYEATGSTRSHYSHNETTCVACAVNHVAASPSRALEAIERAERASPPPSADGHHSAQPILRIQAAPRAPPMELVAI